MALFVLPYTYTDGNVLDAASHETNLYTGNVNGIYYKANGNIDADCLAGGFGVRAEHVWPGEAAQAHQEYALETLDYMDNAMGGTGDASASYVNVAGLGIRFYLPYTAAVVLWQWSFHASEFRFNNFGVAAGAEPYIRTRAYLDNVFVTHSRRTLPVSQYDDTVNNAIMGYEMRNAQHWDMAHLSQNLAAGFHSFDVRVSLEEVNLNENVDVTIGLHTGTYTYEVHHRATFGIRNMRALVLL